MLRTLHVEERAGAERKGDLVRVPVFFAQGECARLEDLAIVPFDGAKDEVPWQADDIRRGPDGGISRVHLWFAIDSKAGESRRFQLVRRSPEEKNAKPRSWTAMELAMVDGLLHVFTNQGQYTWSKTGELRSVPLTGSEWRFNSSGAFPRATISSPAKADQPAINVVLDRRSTNREVTWGSGPLFAKIRVRVVGEQNAVLEQEYRIPRDGRELIITSTVFPGDAGSAVIRENRILEGILDKGSHAGATVARVPAGIRYSLRAEHAYAVTALSRSEGALLAVPLVIGGSNGVWAAEKEGEGFYLQGLRNLKRGKEGEAHTLHAFWTEVRLVPSTRTGPDELWKTYRDHVQPLVAVVEEPGVTIERLHAALRALVREMKPVGWRQDAGRARVMGDLKRTEKILSQAPADKEGDPERLLRSAKGARAKVTNNGSRKLRDDEKGRAYGMLDPYDITYTQSAAAALAALDNVAVEVTAVNYAMAKALRQEGGRVDPAGFPYIDVFGRNLNMQLGPVLFGLTAGAAQGDVGLVQFYRDLATALPVQAVFGRGQRPYTSAPTTRADQTDYLYQAVCDFWLRSAEILGGENLHLHPLAYSRYTDCIDVMADRYHGVAAQDKTGAAGQARANFFRGQTHTHRWLGWSCAPYIRLLEYPHGHDSVGLTEAIHHSEMMKGRWKNWPDLTYYILADLLVCEGLNQETVPNLPARPTGVVVTQGESGVELSWRRMDDASEYRVYKARNAGGPYEWLNSPYRETVLPPQREPRFVDLTGDVNCSYVVTAIDREGRESAWPEQP